MFLRHAGLDPTSRDLMV